MTAESAEELTGPAQSGDAEAQFKLAQVLNYGLGTAIDEDAAINWYQRSADQHFERAQFTLGEICREGRITPQDLVQAHVWYSLVARAGGDLSAAGIEGRSEIEPYMTAEQITSARQQAETWTPGSLSTA